MDDTSSITEGSGNSDAVAVTYQYPFAASPDIIRANQKDAYFQGVLLEQLSSIIRRCYGARLMHKYTTEVRTFADLLYLGLTTFVGNRTLGEEYCDIVQVENGTSELPAVRRRTGYIATTILLPYVLNKVLPTFRHHVRVRLESSLAKAAGEARSKNTRSFNVKQYLLDNLDTLTSPSPVYAISLATFYFSGAYYQIAKRLWGLRYVFTRNLHSSDQRAGYEVLGVLLVLQLTVQAYLHARETITSTRGNKRAIPVIANSASITGSSTTVGGGVEVSLDPNAYSGNNTLLFESGSASDDATQQRISKMTHTPAGSEPRYDLGNKEIMRWLPNRQARKCTLCLEPMKDPSSTTCGHIFCWTCICDWCKEKPECPLCRQMCLIQHVLPLRGR